MPSTVKHTWRWADKGVHITSEDHISLSTISTSMSSWQWVSAQRATCNSMLSWHWMYGCLTVHDMSLCYHLTHFQFHFLQTFQKVCPLCGKSVLQLVTVQYRPCHCIRQMCCNCDTELEKSGTDCCVNHFVSKRQTPRRRMKTCTYMIIHSLVLVDCTYSSYLYDVCMCCTKLLMSIRTAHSMECVQVLNISTFRWRADMRLAGSTPMSWHQIREVIDWILWTSLLDLKAPSRMQTLTFVEERQCMKHTDYFDNFWD